jgi:hypothetical protein
MDASDAAVIKVKLDHIQSDISGVREEMVEVRSDLKSIREESPIYRITQLEAWRDSVRKTITGLVVALLITWGGIVLTYVLNR